MILPRQWHWEVKTMCIENIDDNGQWLMVMHTMGNKDTEYWRQWKWGQWIMMIIVIIMDNEKTRKVWQWE